jgi:hypothetical protein
VAVAADTRVSSGGRPRDEGGHRRVSETEFDQYAADYLATVNEAAGIAGVDVVIAEMARVTRPGGMVAIIEHNPLNPVTRHIVSRCPFDRDAVLLRCGTGARLLAGAGLEPGGAATSPSGRSGRPSSSESSYASAGCLPAPSTTSGQRRAPPFHPVRRRAGRADEEP